MTLTDTHCHLDFHAFDDDREMVLDRARSAGLTRILDPGIDLASSGVAVKLSESYPEVYAAVGIHPSDARQWEPGTPASLHKLAKSPKVVAIGEIGLDYYRDRAPRDVQQRVFHQQLDLAAELNLPVIVHCRDAADDVLGILTDWQSRLLAAGSPVADRPGVLHSFSGEESTARRAIALNFFIGITGPVTFLNARDHQAVIARLPLEKLLIETDAPFLTPHPHRGQRNEPGHVRLVAQKISELHHLPVEFVAETTTANANRLFAWRDDC